MTGQSALAAALLGATLFGLCAPSGAARAQTISSVTQISYDARGNVECTTVRMNAAAFGSLPASACALGTEGSQGPDRITRNFYDAAGQLLKVQKAYGTPLQINHAAYTYSPNGKQTSLTDANGNKAALEYDGLDRQIGWRFPSPTVPGTVSTTDYEAYGYDARSNRTSLRKRDGRTLVYGYDALGRLKVKTVPDACVAGYGCTTPTTSAVRDIYYSYDLSGRQISARFDGAGGADAVVNAYDGLGRLTSATTSMGGVSRSIGYQYDAHGNRTRVTHPDGAYFQYDFDGLDRMVSASWYTPATGSVPFFGISYDAQGRRAATHRGSSSTTYGYDGISRLNNAWQNFTSGSANSADTYGYNPASQIVSRARSNDAYSYVGYAAGTKSYTVNGLNQYVAVGPGVLDYDSNGNLASNGGTSFTYDVENRLVSAAGTLVTTMVYDPLGRLYETSGASGTRRFLYDGDALVGEYDTAGNLLMRYAHGPGVDEPVLADGGGMNCSQTRFLHSDYQGSIVAQADCGGNPTVINTYDEYGVRGSGNVGTFEYTGQAWLPDLDMYYYKARIYSSRLGRFLQTDPIGYADQINLYAYVQNDPIGGRDPSGTCATINGVQYGFCGVGADGRAWVERRLKDPYSMAGDVEAEAVANKYRIDVQTYPNDPQTAGAEFEPKRTNSGVLRYDPGDMVTVTNKDGSSRTYTEGETSEHEINNALNNIRNAPRDNGSGDHAGSVAAENTYREKAGIAFVRKPEASTKIEQNPDYFDLNDLLQRQK